MVSSHLRFILAALTCCVSVAHSPSPSCLAGDSQCASGLALLQKAQVKTKKVSEYIAEQEEAPSGSDDPFELPKQAVVTLGAYPGYKGSLAITGQVNLTTDKGVVGLSWSLAGTEKECGGKTSRIGSGVANACGLHIHTGMTCSTHNDVGGHFFHSGSHGDPWARSVYVSGSLGNPWASIGSTSFQIGAGMEEIVGHAFVVHDHTGGRVACGLIQFPKAPPAKSGAVATGSFVFVALLTSLIVSY